MASGHVPQRIELFPNGEIGIVWDDGREDYLDAFTVRVACPCAQCVDENTGQRMIDPRQVNRDIRARGWDPVGRYAVQFRWTDGHQTGIYPFTLLRALGDTGGQV